MIRNVLSQPPLSILIAQLCLCLTLSACQLASPVTSTPAALVPASPTPSLPLTEAAPTLSATETPTLVATEISATTPAPTAPPATVGFPLSPPTILVLQDNEVMELIGGETRLLTGLAEAGPVLATAITETTLVVLRAQGLQLIDLATNTERLAIPFETPARAGTLLVLAPDRILFTASFDDPGAEFGTSTRVGQYDLGRDQAGPQWTTPDSRWVLGPTADGRNLYTLRVGQDPEFVTIQVVADQTGQVVSELPVRGYAVASLSPDRRYLVTADSDLRQSADLVRAYNLETQPPQQNDVALPASPSQAWKLAWSPTGHDLFFVALSGSIRAGDSEPPRTSHASHGLWRLDAAQATLTKIVDGGPGLEPWVAVSPNGQWLLLRHSELARAYRVNLSNSEVREFTLPAAAIPTASTWDWQPFSSLSTDGDWLLVRGLKEDRSGLEDTVLLTHLPTGISQTYRLPGEALVVGWR